MTMLSQYLRAERRDRTEPIDFYAPGAVDDPEGALLRRRGMLVGTRDRTPPEPPLEGNALDWD